MKKKDTTILLVDDELDILEIIGYNLSAEGYNVVTAQNGVEAIKKAKKHKPELIILDVMMPEMDGIEACEKLRLIPELSETVITFLTARGEDYSQVAGFEAGAGRSLITWLENLKRNVFSGAYLLPHLMFCRSHIGYMLVLLFLLLDGFLLTPQNY